jgi:hypothetical protein
MSGRKALYFIFLCQAFLQEGAVSKGQRENWRKRQPLSNTAKAKKPEKSIKQTNITEKATNHRAKQ